jgi:ABC-2 type transport system permease protein
VIAMTLLAVERIKLFTTRSAWWCSAVAVVLTATFAAMFAAGSPASSPVTVASTQYGSGFGLVVVMVLAALAITTEYRFGTIRATFLAVPHRGVALLAKTAVVAVLCGVIGEVCAFGSVGVAKLVVPNADLGVDTAFEWRAVAGTGLVFALAGVLAVAVGTLIRHSAGAIALLLVYSQGVEQLISLIPRVGPAAHKWLPFNVANRFLTGDADLTSRRADDGLPVSDAVLSPWVALLYFAAVAAILLTAAIVTTNRRDA